MAQYTFIKHRELDNRHDLTTIQVDAEATTLDEMLSVFTDFLKASGFQIDINKELDFVEEWGGAV